MKIITLLWKDKTRSFLVIGSPNLSQVVRLGTKFMLRHTSGLPKRTTLSARAKFATESVDQ